eukprot:TRINITY_DN3956_c0_g2_i1.p1 TRINITY_DN3956_c0_g2~~TRINITY_DN3956_c0_g2_i1.p1  ORF type:complete len:357 (-),score=69.84 TRINITY_DN3956_c0_g2_i1:115-1164(-)
MGKKLLAAGSIMSMVAVLFSIICLFLPLQNSIFHSVGFMPLLKITTYSLTANLWASKTLFGFCKAIAAVTSLKDICDRDGATVSLQELQQAFCTAATVQIVEDGCTGAGFAYGMGIALVVVAVTNAIMQGVGSFLIYQYFNSSMKKQYRETALVLDIIGTILMIFIVIVYYPTAIAHLDSMQPAGGGLMNLVVSKGDSPMATGYLMLMLVPVVQAVSIGLLFFGQSSEEVRQAELREEKKFQMEMAMFNEAAAAGRPEERGNQQQGVQPPPHSWAGHMDSQGFAPQQPLDLSGFGFQQKPNPYAARQNPYPAQGSQQFMQPQASGNYRVQVMPGTHQQMSAGPGRGPYF